MPPALPYPITGTVTDSKGQLVTNQNVKLVNKTQSSEDLYVQTDSNGLYLADAANFNTSYELGDEVEIFVINGFCSEEKLETFTISGTSKDLDIVLEVITEFPPGCSSNQVYKNALVNVNGKPFTEDNALFVVNEDRLYVQRREYNAQRRLEFRGWAAVGRFNDTDKAIWRIEKHFIENNRDTGQAFADGSTDFKFKWDDRESLTYK